METGSGAGVWVLSETGDTGRDSTVASLIGSGTNGSGFSEASSTFGEPS